MYKTKVAYNIVQRSEPKKKPLTAKELFGI